MVELVVVVDEVVDELVVDDDVDDVDEMDDVGDVLVSVVDEDGVPDVYVRIVADFLPTSSSFRRQQK